MDAAQKDMTSVMYFCAFLFLGIILAAMPMIWKYQNKRTKTFIAILAENAAMCLVLGIAYGPEIPALSNPMLILSFGLHYAILASYSFYVIQTLEAEGPVSHFTAHASIVLCAASFILFFMSTQGADMTKGTDVYQMRFYIPAQICGLMVIGMTILLMIRHRDKIGWRSILELGLLPVIPFLLSEAAKYFTPMPLRALFISLCNLRMYVLLHVAGEQKIAVQEKQLAQDRMTISISQIRPHFIFNSLSTIYYLCDTDPKRAKEAVMSFSHYLRTNLELIDREQVIPFLQELRHVQYYMELEKLRYGDRIQVNYVIQARDFQIPILSVQPLVENAIKHGLARLEEGGKLTIATSENRDEYVVTVSNDGPPYQAVKAETEQDDHISVGIQSVRDRVALLMGGSVEIRQGEQGEGAVVEIHLPRRKQHAGGQQ